MAIVHGIVAVFDTIVSDFKTSHQMLLASRLFPLLRAQTYKIRSPASRARVDVAKNIRVQCSLRGAVGNSFGLG